MKDIVLMKDMSEVVPYQYRSLGIYIHKLELYQGKERVSLWHWHDDIELTYVLRGKLEYHVDQQLVVLHEGDGIFVNTKKLHCSHMPNEDGCEHISVLFKPEKILMNDHIRHQYIDRITAAKNFTYQVFTTEDAPWFGEYIDKMYKIKECGETANELEIAGLICYLWRKIYQNCSGNIEIKMLRGNNEEDIQKEMEAYICNHYTEMISLDNIAAIGGVSRSKCCQMFKKYVELSPVEFLNMYRLKMSRFLLETTNKKVVDIATECGFNHASYFDKRFKKAFGQLPKEYRRKNDN